MVSQTKKLPWGCLLGMRCATGNPDQQWTQQVHQRPFLGVGRGGSVYWDCGWKVLGCDRRAWGCGDWVLGCGGTRRDCGVRVMGYDPVLWDFLNEATALAAPPGQLDHRPRSPTTPHLSHCSHYSQPVMRNTYLVPNNY